MNRALAQHGSGPCAKVIEGGRTLLLELLRSWPWNLKNAPTEPSFDASMLEDEPWLPGKPSLGMPRRPNIVGAPGGEAILAHLWWLPAFGPDPPDRSNASPWEPLLRGSQGDAMATW